MNGRPRLVVHLEPFGVFIHGEAVDVETTELYAEPNEGWPFGEAVARRAGCAAFTKRTPTAATTKTGWVVGVCVGFSDYLDAQRKMIISVSSGTSKNSAGGGGGLVSQLCP